ncbi:hypothetical protein K2173_019688 [Erythroxylum novogranatense]|uniref:Uncharacterized protein n=1 Tax=Erythroxylum novogranatense TaxID=1862640 RepID=A0AAV8SMS6_9ROSI|nr:hypothetical protein K2173_019688 [Erythroxylum novogranatense]
MGVSGRPAELLEIEAVLQIQVPVIRRFSGGGTVIVDQETIFVTSYATQVQFLTYNHTLDLSCPGHFRLFVPLMLTSPTIYISLIKTHAHLMSPLTFFDSQSPHHDDRVSRIFVLRFVSSFSS